MGACHSSRSISPAASVHPAVAPAPPPEATDDKHAAAAASPTQASTEPPSPSPAHVDRYGFYTDPIADAGTNKDNHTYSDAVWQSVATDARLFAEYASPEYQSQLLAMTHGMHNSHRVMVYQQLSHNPAWPPPLPSVIGVPFMSQSQWWEPPVMTAVANTDTHSDIDSGNDSNISQILVDIGRTFPHHAYFGHSAGRASLQRTLVAVCRECGIQYVQGMNLLAASSLILCRGDEAQSVALTTHLLVHHHCQSLFTDGMPALQSMLAVIDRVLAARYRPLQSLLIDSGMSAVLFASANILSFTAYSLPFADTAVIWDQFMLDQSFTRSNTSYRARSSGCDSGSGEWSEWQQFLLSIILVCMRRVQSMLPLEAEEALRLLQNPSKLWITTGSVSVLLDEARALRQSGELDKDLRSDDAS